MTFEAKTETSTEPRTQSQVNEEAVEWILRLNLDDIGEEQRRQLQVEFDRWLSADNRHEQAWLKAEQARYALPEVYEILPEEVGILTRQKIADSFLSELLGKLLRPAVALPLAAVLLLGVFIVKPLMEGPQSAVERYASTTAEIRRFSLSDGSEVTLGARSSIDVSFNDNARQVVLDDGDVYFSVSKDPQRPFVVTAGDVQVRVVGTEFGLHHGQQQIQIHLVEGAVDVSTGTQSLRLTAGQSLAIVDGQIGKVNALPSSATSWLDGWLEYNGASLSEVIADANRYSDRPITLASPELQRFTVTTAYNVDQLTDMLKSLEKALPLQVVETPMGILLKERPEEFTD